MMNYNSDKKTLEIVFLIDSSESMKGSLIGTINTSIEELVSDIKEIAEARPDDNVNIRCISYSNGSKWTCLEHVPAQTFRWCYLNAEGKSDLGSGCLRLKQFFDKGGFSIDNSYRPIIFLLAGSMPTDNFKYAMFKLSENEWFKKALKIAVDFSEQPVDKVLLQFTGNRRNILDTCNPSVLKRWIQFFQSR